MQACLRGDVSDRAPVALWRHFPVDDQTPDGLAQAHLAFQRTYDFDILKVTPASSYSVKDWGVEDVWEGNSEGTRTYSKHVINRPADWERLPVLDPRTPHLSAQIDSLRRIRRELGPETPIVQTIFSALSQAKHLAGETTLLLHLRTAPSAVERGLETITKCTQRFIQEAGDAGIDGIFLAVQHAQAGVLSQEEFARFSRNSDLAVLKAAGGLWCNMLHLHGEHVYFDAVLDYPVQIINWHDRETAPTLTAARQKWKGVLCGGLGLNTLVYKSPAEIQLEASEALSSLNRRGLVLSTGCVIPIVTPLGNILAARLAVGGNSKADGHATA
jgi:uroporphyrinogen decarboxylase